MLQGPNYELQVKDIKKNRYGLRVAGYGFKIPTFQYSKIPSFLFDPLLSEKFTTVKSRKNLKYLIVITRVILTLNTHNLSNL